MIHIPTKTFLSSRLPSEKLRKESAVCTERLHITIFVCLFVPSWSQIKILETLFLSNGDLPCVRLYACNTHSPPFANFVSNTMFMLYWNHQQHVLLVLTLNDFMRLVQCQLAPKTSPTHSHLYSVLGEDEGFHGRPYWLSWLTGSALLQTIHPLEDLHLLGNAFYFLQAKSDPSPDIKKVKLSADFILGLSAVHSFPYIWQSGFQLLLLTVPFNFCLSLCCHGNQVRLKEQAHMNLTNHLIYFQIVLWHIVCE